MTDKKHIDRIFQEKFKNFEATPDDVVWENIHNALHKDKRKRRAIPLWWYAAGAAAILVMLFAVGIVFNSDGLRNPEIQTAETEATRGAAESTKTLVVDESKANGDKSEDSNSIATTEQSDDSSEIDNFKNDVHENPENDKVNTHIAQENSEENRSGTSNSNDEINTAQKDRLPSNIKEKAVAKNTPNLPELDPNRKVAESDNVSDKANFENHKEQSKIAQTTDQDIIKPSETLKVNKDVEIIEEAIAKANSTNEKEKEEQPNRWNITPNVAPVYFNSLGKGSTISSQFVSNSKSGEVNMSYGISGSYALNDKIKIRAGVNKVALGYSTDGVMAFNDINSFNNTSGSTALRNIKFKNQAQNASYMSTADINSKSAPQFMISNVNGALEQQFGYIEVPLEVEYSLIDSKFGVNIIGGFSTLFLNNNEVYSVMANQKSLLGEANNINSTSYSANLGLGFNYNLSRTLKLNLEPMFKYQLNTFTNTSGDFQPYFIGVYTGFSFKF